jgi:hypothetical protein
VSGCEIPQRHALNLYLAGLAGEEPEGGLLELRTKPAGGSMRRLGFFSAHDRPPIMAAILDAAANGDVYVGVAPRRVKPTGELPSGGVDAIERVWMLFVDADTPESCEALRSFQPQAAILIHSGNGLHGYWPLRKPLAPEHAKRANRRLAHKLGADMNATDAARIMRPPATLNWKGILPKRVVCERLDTLAYAAADVVGALEDPPPQRPRLTRVEQPPTSSTPSRSGGSARAALQGAARVVRDAPVGNRNASLNWAAWALGQRIASGELNEQEVRAELRAAAEAAGLDEIEIEGTLTSGLNAGRAA